MCDLVLETFGKYITNPTKWLALSANGKIIADYEIHSLVLPSVIAYPEGIENAGETIVRKAKEIGANVIISFGMASETKGFRVERSGLNWAFNEKYLTAEENNHPLDSSRPGKEHAKINLSFWDFDKMQTLFSDARLPFETAISEDAGNYVCNSWIYRTLVAMEKQNLKIPYLFIHTSCTKEAIELIPDFDKNKMLIKKEDTLQALGVILQSLKI